MAHEPIEPGVFAAVAEQISAIDRDSLLVEPPNFVVRDQARRGLTEGIVARLERLIDGADKGERKKLRALKRQAGVTKSRLDQADELLYATVRTYTQRDDYPTICLELFRQYEEQYQRELWSDPPLYDRLDTFVDGLLQIEELPRIQRPPEEEMVLYQPTPARIVLDLVRRLQLGPHDVFYDLGSGLGRVALIVGLVSDAQVHGVEYEPTYVDYARRRTRILGLQRATFTNADVRDVAYKDGTVFYLYTPFKGKILQRVLDMLQHEARSRRIRICTYGPGTLEVLGQTWFRSTDDWEPDIHRPTIYESY